MKISPPARRSLPIAICFTLAACTAASSGAPTTAAEPSKSAKQAKAAATAAPAAAEVPELTPVTLLALVRSAKILDPDYPVHVTINGKEATLATMRHPKATDQDCKIDAVLVAKSVMDVYPKDVARIKLVLNLSNSDIMEEVTVTTGDVKAYATGTISKDDLLTSLELKKLEGAEKESGTEFITEGSRAVAAGPFRYQRQLLAGRIEKLKARGTGTQPFEEMMGHIEQDVKKPQGELAPGALQKEIHELDSHLYEQEEAIRAAQNIGANNASSRSRFYGQQGAPLSGKMGMGMRQGGKQDLNARIGQLESKGQNVQGLRQDFQHMRTLMNQGNFADAAKERKALFQKIEAMSRQ